MTAMSLARVRLPTHEVEAGDWSGEEDGGYDAVPYWGCLRAARDADGPVGGR